MSTPTYITASQLFARAHGAECTGIWKCHWCGAPATNEFLHDDPPPIPFTRSRSTALHPNEKYVCLGCWHWHMKSVSVRFLSGGLKDRQEARHHSWWVTETEAVALRHGHATDAAALYEKLLRPPKHFFLALRVFGEGVDALLQLARVNSYEGIHADMPLRFTVNNIVHEFSVYELTEAVKNSPKGYGPGVRALVEWLGAPPAELKKRLMPPEEKKNIVAGKDVGGRPKPKDDAKTTARKVVVASGNAA